MHYLDNSDQHNRDLLSTSYSFSPLLALLLSSKFAIAYLYNRYRYYHKSLSICSAFPFVVLYYYYYYYYYHYYY